MSPSNILAVIALFVALGGTAYATHGGLNTISTEDIINGQVQQPDIGTSAVNSTRIANQSIRDEDLAPDTVRGSKVEDESLSGDDVDANSLSGPDIDEPSLDPEQLPATASFASQIRNVGTDGDVLYGAGSGRTTASTDMTDVQMVGGPGYDFFGMQAWVETAPGPGESRTFWLVRRAQPGWAIFDTNVNCTIGEGEQFCTNSQFASMGDQLFAIKVESVGAGLSSADDAYVGLTAGD